MAGSLEDGAEVEVIPDLAVEDGYDGAVLVRQRLRSSLQIEDREPRMTQEGRAGGVNAAAVGPPVAERADRALHGLPGCLALVPAHESDDSAHGKETTRQGERRPPPKRGEDHLLRLVRQGDLWRQCKT
jgi:hypothetical protein